MKPDTLHDGRAVGCRTSKRRKHRLHGVTGCARLGAPGSVTIGQRAVAAEATVGRCATDIARLSDRAVAWT